MTDELQRLREFRADIGAPDDVIAQRVYARATQSGASGEGSPTRAVPSYGRRRVIGALAAAGILATSLIGVLTFHGSSVPRRPMRAARTDRARLDAHGFGQRQLGLGWRPSVAQPLPPGAQQVQLADASSLLGGSLALPNSNLVTGSDAGPVWANALHDPESGFTQNTIAVTFPSQGVIVEYQRPASFSDPAAHYKGEAGQQPGSQLLNLNGVTGLGIDQNVDGQGNFGVVDFVSGGTRVVVLGHYNQSTLQQIALSILPKLGTTSP